MCQGWKSPTSFINTLSRHYFQTGTIVLVRWFLAGLCGISCANIVRGGADHTSLRKNGDLHLYSLEKASCQPGALSLPFGSLCEVVLAWEESCLLKFRLKLFCASLSTGVCFLCQGAAIKISAAISLTTERGQEANMDSLSAVWVRGSFWVSVRNWFYPVLQLIWMRDWHQVTFSGHKKVMWNRTLERTVIKTHSSHDDWI